MKVIMTCGGTGGHIYPAIAIADKIKEKNPDAEILFIGTKKGMENRLVPAAGYEIKGIDASGLDRHSIVKNIKTAENLIKGEHEAKKIIHEFEPDVVVGTGGYVTGTVVYCGHKFGARCFIHEQNAYPGVANKLLEGLCEKVFISFPEAAQYFKHQDKIILSGNPIRHEFIDKQSDEAEYILVCGGSLGAEMINKAAIELTKQVNDKIVFVTGKRYYDEIKANKFPENVELIDYENDMPSRMSKAKLVISRAGAITLSEILASGKVAVFIPSPNVTANHQYHNAKSVCDAGAAIMVEEKELAEDISVLAKRVKELLADENKIADMSQKAKELANLDATDRIYHGIYG